MVCPKYQEKIANFAILFIVLLNIQNVSCDERVQLEVYLLDPVPKHQNSEGSFFDVQIPCQISYKTCDHSKMICRVDDSDQIVSN